ncbi:hypothetical protein KUCAC02_025072, partial [Chaenocephalus aceratus]
LSAVPPLGDEKVNCDGPELIENVKPVLNVDGDPEKSHEDTQNTFLTNNEADMRGNFSLEWFGQPASELKHGHGLLERRLAPCWVSVPDLTTLRREGKFAHTPESERALLQHHSLLTAPPYRKGSARQWLNVARGKIKNSYGDYT